MDPFAFVRTPEDHARFIEGYTVGVEPERYVETFAEGFNSLFKDHEWYMIQAKRQHYGLDQVLGDLGESPQDIYLAGALSRFDSILVRQRRYGNKGCHELGCWDVWKHGDSALDWLHHRGLPEPDSFELGKERNRFLFKTPTRTYSLELVKDVRAAVEVFPSMRR